LNVAIDLSMNQGCGSINAPALFNVALSLKNIAGSTLNVDGATLNVDRSACFIERDSFNVEAACKDATGACQQFRIQGRFRAIPTMPGTRQRSPDPRRCCTACSSCRSAKACIWHCFFCGLEHAGFNCIDVPRRKDGAFIGGNIRTGY